MGGYGIRNWILYGTCTGGLDGKEKKGMASVPFGFGGLERWVGYIQDLQLCNRYLLLRRFENVQIYITSRTVSPIFTNAHEGRETIRFLVPSSITF